MQKENMKIAIVSDDDRIIEIFRDSLLKEGIAVSVITKFGNRLRSGLSDLNYDCVLLDEWSLSDIGLRGIGILKDLFRETPVFILSGDMDFDAISFQIPTLCGFLPRGIVGEETVFRLAENFKNLFSGQYNQPRVQIDFSELCPEKNLKINLKTLSEMWSISSTSPLWLFRITNKKTIESHQLNRKSVNYNLGVFPIDSHSLTVEDYFQRFVAHKDELLFYKINDESGYKFTICTTKKNLSINELNLFHYSKQVLALQASKAVKTLDHKVSRVLPKVSLDVILDIELKRSQFFKKDLGVLLFEPQNRVFHLKEENLLEYKKSIEDSIFASFSQGTESIFELGFLSWLVIMPEKKWEHIFHEFLKLKKSLELITNPEESELGPIKKNLNWVGSVWNSSVEGGLPKETNLKEDAKIVQASLRKKISQLHYKNPVGLVHKVKWSFEMDKGNFQSLERT